MRSPGKTLGRNPSLPPQSPRHPRSSGQGLRTPAPLTWAPTAPCCTPRVSIPRNAAPESTVLRNSAGASGKEAGRTQVESARDGPEEAARPPAGPGGLWPRACFVCVCWSATHRAGHVHGSPYSPRGSPGPRGSRPGTSRARRAHEDRSQSPRQYHKSQEQSDLSLQKTNSKSK